MAKMLAVIPELCSGCRLCELVCAARHFGVNNPRKAAVRVLVTYPHPVVRMPVVCSQCKMPVCADACPVGALRRVNGLVHLDTETFSATPLKRGNHAYFADPTAQIMVAAWALGDDAPTVEARAHVEGALEEKERR